MEKESAVNDLTLKNYAKRFERVFAYIEQHLDESLSVKELSRVAHFQSSTSIVSFFQYVGLGVAAYVPTESLLSAGFRSRPGHRYCLGGGLR